MGNDKRANRLFGVGVTVGLIVGLTIGRRDKTNWIPHLDAWQRALAEEWGEAGAAMLASRVRARYNLLCAQRPRFARRALQSHLEYNILPGLALYQVLLEETGAQEDALAEVADLFEVAPARSRSMPPRPGGLPELDRFRRGVLAAYGAPELALAFCGGEGE